MLEPDNEVLKWNRQQITSHSELNIKFVDKSGRVTLPES